MIKFFRNIRKSLINEGKTRKYFRYASGEIILVVIGILIALQINNWNESRKEHLQESILLEQLLSDFNSNLEQLDQKISMREDFIYSVKQLFRYIDNPLIASKDSVDIYIGKTMPYATFDPIIVDLASSGELKLITSNDLKQAVTRWTSDIKDVIEDEIIWRDYRNDMYAPFLIQNYQLRTIRNQAYKLNILGNYTMDRENTIAEDAKNNIGNSHFEADYVALLKNPDFEDHLTRCYAVNYWTNVQSHILRKRILEIIELIKQELE